MSPTKRNHTLAVTCLALGILGTRSAAAQDERAGDVSVQRFAPAPGAKNLLTVAGVRMDGEMSFAVGAFVNYASQPLRLRHCTPASCDDAGAVTRQLAVVRHLATLDLLGALVIVPRFQIGVRLPVSMVRGDGVVSDRGSAQFGQARPGGLSGTGLGDPAVEAKVRAVGDATSPVVAGVAFTATAPLGRATSPDAYLGDASASAGAKGIVDVRFGKVFAAANAGGVYRSKAVLGSLELGPEARFGAGAGYDVAANVRVLGEVFGSTNFSSTSGTNAAEADAAVQMMPTGAPVQLTVGGGTGLNKGLGAPLFRAFVGATYALEPPPKIIAGPVDADGDGILDADDKCPREGGDVVRTAGPYFGCPHRDGDGDGIEDSQDACPDKRGVTTPDPATNGCPDPDRDHDGIPNDNDKCPDAPETVNGVDDADGCPDVVPIKVEVRQDQIVVINEHINFEFRSDKLAGTRSLEALDLVAEVMKQHPEMRRVEVAGHTDNVGPHDENQTLSERRAAAVVAYLGTKGIGRERLIAKGYGTDKPIADNATEAGRAENRRVEFKILVIAK